MFQKDIKQVVGSLVSELDFYFENKGFARRKNGFVYTRKINTTVQKIDMVFFSNPSYYHNVLAHIYPQLSVYYPDIQDLAKEILGDTIITSGLKNKILRQPIQVYHDSEDWILYNEKDNITIGKKIRNFLVEYSIPLLNDINNIDGYLDAYRNDDKRIIKDDRQYVYFACACALKKDFNEGYEIIKKRFGKKGPRRQYASLFTYFEEKLELK